MVNPKYFVPLDYPKAESDGKFWILLEKQGDRFLDSLIAQ